MTSNHEQILADQRAAGRSMDDGASSHSAGARLYMPTQTTSRLKLKLKPSVVAPKGHEAYLKALENSGATVYFEKASSGDKFSGRIKTSDKYTVSIQTDEGTRVVFKHDISEFFVCAPAKAETLQ